MNTTVFNDIPINVKSTIGKLRSVKRKQYNNLFLQLSEECIR